MRPAAFRIKMPDSFVSFEELIVSYSAFNLSCREIAEELELPEIIVSIALQKARTDPKLRRIYKRQKACMYTTRTG